MKKFIHEEVFKALSIYFLATVLLIAVQAWIQVSYPAWWDGGVREGQLLTFLNLGWYLLITGVFIAVFKPALHEEWAAFYKDGKRTAWSWILQGVIVMYFIQIGLGLILNATGLFEVSENQTVLVGFLEMNVATQISVALFGVFLAPFTEEFLFRRSLFRYLQKKGPLAAAVILTSILFGFLHAVTEITNIRVIIPYVAIGIVLQLYYIRSGSLMVTIGMHAIYNAISIGLIILAYSLRFLPDLPV